MRRRLSPDRAASITTPVRYGISSPDAWEAAASTVDTITCIR